MYDNWHAAKVSFRCVHSVSYSNTAAPVYELCMGMAQSESFGDLKWQFSFFCSQLPS